MESRQVYVFTAARGEYLGIGNYLGETTLRKEAGLGDLADTLRKEEAGLISNRSTAKIQLASGEIILGNMCAWRYVEKTQK